MQLVSIIQKRWGDSELKNETNCDVNTKLETTHKGITGSQNRCICNFISVGIYISGKYRGYQKGIRHRENLQNNIFIRSF